MKAYRFDIVVIAEEINDKMTLKEIFNNNIISIDYKEVQLKDKYKKLLEKKNARIE